MISFAYLYHVIVKRKLDKLDLFEQKLDLFSTKDPDGYTNYTKVERERGEDMFNSPILCFFMCCLVAKI